MKYIVIDIDGTIAEPGERLKYLEKDPPDYDSFYADSFDDKPIMPIIDLVNSLAYDANYATVFCTGRRESVRLKTYEWLDKYIYRDKPFLLLMRPNDNYKHDTEVKPMLLADANIMPENTAFILEDRDSIVNRWRELGYICLQVRDGNY